MKHITVAQGAKVKEVSKQSIHNAIAAGKIRAEWLGSQRVIVCDDKWKAWEPNRTLQAANIKALERKEA